MSTSTTAFATMSPEAACAVSANDRTVPLTSTSYSTSNLVFAVVSTSVPSVAVPATFPFAPA